MNIRKEILRESTWKMNGSNARLMYEDTCLVDMRFGSKKTLVQIEDRFIYLQAEGFWNPHIIMTENYTPILQQHYKGLWNTESIVNTNKGQYFAKTHQGQLFNIAYKNTAGVEILSYTLTQFCGKPVFEFSLGDIQTMNDDTIYLLMLGFYTIRNIMLENGIETAAMYFSTESARLD